MLCSEILSSVLEQTAAGWDCRPVGPDQVLITTPHQLSDGDHVEVIVRADGNKITVTDGGEILTRLDTAGVTVKSGRARNVWRSLIRSHEIDDQRGRLILEGTEGDAAWLVERMANAMTNLDGLRLLAPPPRAPRFTEKVVTFLQAEFEFVQEQPVLRGRSGASFKLTAAAAAGPRARPTYLQAVAGSSIQARQRAVEHSFTMFSDVNGALDPRQKVTILSDQVQEWRAEHVKLLSTVGYVASWGSRDRVVDFIQGQSTIEGRLLFSEEEQLALD